MLAPRIPPMAATDEGMGEVMLSSSGMTITAGSTFELPIKVDRPSVLRIRFEVDEGYDVDFSLKFREDTDKASIQTLVEPARSSAREGQLDIHTTGTCYVIWDNAFSWINPKSLTYHLSLRSKDDIEKARQLELARLAQLRAAAAVEAKEAMRTARASMIAELEGQVLFLRKILSTSPDLRPDFVRHGLLPYFDVYFYVNVTSDQLFDQQVQKNIQYAQWMPGV